jgi:hypothetical protein
LKKYNYIVSLHIPHGGYEICRQQEDQDSMMMMIDILRPHCLFDKKTTIGLSV